MMFEGVIAWASKYALALLGGALALSVVGNVATGFLAKHYSEKYQECHAATKVVNKTATEKVRVVNVRQEKTVAKDEARASRRVADIDSVIILPPRVQHSSGVGDLPRTPEAGTNTDGAGPATDLYEVSGADLKTCGINTVKAEEWQAFYNDVLGIWEEENVGKVNPKSDPVPSESGGTVP